MNLPKINMKLAMIPARMGSQRLKQKNLCEVGGIPLITRAIRKCKEAQIFDEIWVNSENSAFGEIARTEGVQFHQRPEELGGNAATSEQYIFEFLQKHSCDALFQVHSIAPLLTASEIKGFVQHYEKSSFDTLLSVVDEQIECAYDEKPINFTFAKKTNSQELKPIQRFVWSITGWKASTYLQAAKNGKCATYDGKVGFFPISRMAGHIIKTEEDLKIAEALLPLVKSA
jgi:CMP-N-acetylneuraminic acid synthetase